MQPTQELLLDPIYLRHQNFLNTTQQNLKINEVAIRNFKVLTLFFLAICGASLATIFISPIILGSVSAVSLLIVILARRQWNQEVALRSPLLKTLRNIFTDVLKEEQCQLTDRKRRFFITNGALCHGLNLSGFTPGTDVRTFLAWVKNQLPEGEPKQLIHTALETQSVTLRSFEELRMLCGRIKTNADIYKRVKEREIEWHNDAELKPINEKRLDSALQRLKTILQSDLQTLSEREKTHRPIKLQDVEEVVNYLPNLQWLDTSECHTASIRANNRILAIKWTNYLVEAHQKELPGLDPHLDQMVGLPLWNNTAYLTALRNVPTTDVE